MFPPITSKKVIAKRPSRPDLRTSLDSSRIANLPKTSPRRVKVPKGSSGGPKVPRRPNASSLLAGPSQILRALPWPSETTKQQQQSYIPQTPTMNLLRPDRWQAPPRAPVRILQRPVISRPTPHLVDDLDRMEAFINPRPAPLVPRVVVKLPIVAPRLNAEAGGQSRNGLHHGQAQAQARVEGSESDTGKTTMPRIIRTVDNVQLPPAGAVEARDLPSANETNEIKNSGLRWSFEPVNLPYANTKLLSLNSYGGRKSRLEAFRYFKEQMDREKEEYDLELWRSGWREMKRDQRIVEWLERIPREVEEDVNEELLCAEEREMVPHHLEWVW